MWGVPAPLRWPRGRKPALPQPPEAPAEGRRGAFCERMGAVAQQKGLPALKKRALFHSRMACLEEKYGCCVITKRVCLNEEGRAVSHQERLEKTNQKALFRSSRRACLLAVAAPRQTVARSEPPPPPSSPGPAAPPPPAAPFEKTPTIRYESVCRTRRACCKTEEPVARL